MILGFLKKYHLQFLLLKISSNSMENIDPQNQVLSLTKTAIEIESKPLLHHSHKKFSKLYAKVYLIYIY